MRQNGIRDDPVVEEVRRIRRQLWHEAGGTFEGYSRLVERLSAELIDGARKRAKRPSKAPSKRRR